MTACSCVLSDTLELAYDSQSFKGQKQTMLINVNRLNQVVNIDAKTICKKTSQIYVCRAVTTVGRGGVTLPWKFFFVKRGFFWPFRDALSANFQTLSANKGWLIKIAGKWDLNTLPLPLSKIASDGPVCMTYTPYSRA